jgi:rod shape-determining protein MreD
MSRTRAIVAAVMFVALVVLHFTLRPLLGWRAGIDFLVIGVLFVAARVRPGGAAVLGCAMGLMADSVGGTRFGAAAIAMTIVAGGASWLKAAFFSETAALDVVFLFVGKMAFDLIFLFVEGRVRGIALVQQVALWSTASAVVSALVGALLISAARAVVTPDYPRRR